MLAVLEDELVLIRDDCSISPVKDAFFVGLPFLYFSDNLIFLIDLRYKLFFFIIVHRCIL